MDAYHRELMGHLSRFVTSRRLDVFRKVLKERTRYLTVLLEDIYQPQNASAVLRTCDCTGIQDVHIVERRNEYRLNPDVALGSDQWLSICYYRNPERPLEDAVANLKKNDYRIVATSPHREDAIPENFDLQKGKAALLFGTELNGLTEEALELADEYIRIPMVGFTESYNISVSAAIILYHLRRRLVGSGVQWWMLDEEKDDLLLEWLRKSIRQSELIEKEFRREYRSKF